MFEYERERDDCPMFFDDGENPWKQTESYDIVFNWLIYKNDGASHSLAFFSLGLSLTVAVGVARRYF
jgi:hypothetical protein